MLFVAAKKVCTCKLPGGNGTTGTSCPKDNDEFCGSCPSTHWLSKATGVCNLNTDCDSKGKWEKTAATISADAECGSDKECTCRYGFPAKGKRCPQHQTKYCASCNDGYALNGGNCTVVQTTTPEPVEPAVFLRVEDDEEDVTLAPVVIAAITVPTVLVVIIVGVVVAVAIFAFFNAKANNYTLFIVVPPGAVPRHGYKVHEETGHLILDHKTDLKNWKLLKAEDLEQRVAHALVEKGNSTEVVEPIGLSPIEITDKLKAFVTTDGKPDVLRHGITLGEMGLPSGTVLSIDLDPKHDQYAGHIDERAPSMY